MAKRIKLMADYDCFPLWAESGDLSPNIDPRTLSLSATTVAALLGWADRYDATLNRDDPKESGFSTPSEAQDFERQGLQLWSTLQHELGAEFQVSFFSVQQRRLLPWPPAVTGRT